MLGSRQLGGCNMTSFKDLGDPQNALPRISTNDAAGCSGIGASCQLV
jgi:hypothetical protein